jgi:hypothetical protein
MLISSSQLSKKSQRKVKEKLKSNESERLLSDLRSGEECHPSSHQRGLPQTGFPIP